MDQRITSLGTGAPGSRARRKNRATKEKDFPTALYLLSILIAALGLSLIFLVPQGYTSYQVQSQATNWPQTTGKVVSADIIVDERTPDLNDDRVQPKIRTQYSVDGKEYVTREIHFNQSRSWSNDKSNASVVVEKYPPGTQVQVYYNPRQPSQAVLDTNYDWFTFFIMGLGAALVLLGAYWFCLALRDTDLFTANLVSKLRQ